MNCRVAIPAASAGILLGKGGSTFRSMSEETGAELAMNDKSEAGLIEERVITISGTVAQCMNCSAVILGKIGEQEGGFAYLVNGTAYPLRLTAGRAPYGVDQGRRSNFQSNAPYPPSRQISVYGTSPTGGDRGRFLAAASLPVKTLEASASVELAVPDALMGAILGIKVRVDTYSM